MHRAGAVLIFIMLLSWSALGQSPENGDAHRQANLAALYLQGQGVPKDESEAAKWMRKAANQGLAARPFVLRLMDAHGTRVPESATEAIVWYRKAAEQSDAPGDE